MRVETIIEECRSHINCTECPYWESINAAIVLGKCIFRDTPDKWDIHIYKNKEGDENDG